jgi:hypothetical protein
MIEAAAVVRARGPRGFAGLDRESADSLGALHEPLTEDWRERPTLRGCGSTRPNPRAGSAVPWSAARGPLEPAPG